MSSDPFDWANVMREEADVMISLGAYVNLLYGYTNRFLIANNNAM